MHWRFSASSTQPHLLLALLSWLTLPACSETAPEQRAATRSEALINGTVASGLYTAVARRGSGCSSVLVAPRVVLTSAHCVETHALGCTSVAATPFSIVFAEPAGGWSNSASFTNRSVAVRGLVHRPELFDLAACPASASSNCSDPVRENIDHSKELVVLYLEKDAPADVTPLPLLLAADVDTSQSAAEVGVFLGLEQWVASAHPVVTTVGYGDGSHAYDVNGTQRPGRDYGLQRWLHTNTGFAGLLGMLDCETRAPSSLQPGIVVSPQDLTLSQIGGDAEQVAPGAQFPAQHSHSGSGDSGGPVLVGHGASAKGDQPTPLPAPGAGDSYDAGKNYVAGTASVWVDNGGETLKTAFTPTYTAGAAEFLMDALRDSDGDGYADPVDDDSDNDGCDDSIDQHAQQGETAIGTLIHANCSPSASSWLLDEGVDSDGDGLLNCEDPDDDNDHSFDDDDPCPVHAGQRLCYKPGNSCPWNPIFFDCLLAGCSEFLRLMNAVNPDPARTVAFAVRAASERVVVVAPAAGYSLAQSAALLAGQLAFGGASASRPESAAALFLLDVVGPDRRVRGSIAAYEPRGVRVGDLRGANALELRLGADGQSLEIVGANVATPR